MTIYYDYTHAAVMDVLTYDPNLVQSDAFNAANHAFTDVHGEMTSANVQDGIVEAYEHGGGLDSATLMFKDTYDPTSQAADVFDAGNMNSGVLSEDHGGLGADVSAETGLLYIDSGSTSASTIGVGTDSDEIPKNEDLTSVYAPADMALWKDGRVPLDNDAYLSATNYAGDDTIPLFKVDTNDQFELEADLYLDQLYFKAPEESGSFDSNMLDIAGDSRSLADDKLRYNFAANETPLLTIALTADGAGGFTDESVDIAGNFGVDATDFSGFDTELSVQRIGYNLSLVTDRNETGAAWLANNAIFDGSDWKYEKAGAAGLITLDMGEITLNAADDGTAGGVISWNDGNIFDGDEYGMFSYFGSSATTTTVLSNTWYKVNGTYTNSHIYNFVWDTDHFEYTGDSSRTFMIRWVAAIAADTTGIIETGIKLNTTVITSSIQRRRMPTSNHYYPAIGQFVYTLPQGTDIQFNVRSSSAGAIVTFLNVQFSIEPFPGK